MPRPNRALCGIVLGLAVVIGCAKKPKTDTVASGQTDSTPTPAPTPAPSGKPGPGKVVPAAGQGTPDTQPAPGTDGLHPVGATVASGTGTVELLQCRFDKVEAALTAAKGKVVLVDCWARWCGPCIDSFPKLVEKHEKYGPKGLVCVSVSIDNGRNAFTPDQVHSFLKEKKATFQNFYLSDLRTDNAAMERRFGQISGIPYAVLLNKKSEKIWQGHPLNLTASMIEAELAK